MHFLLFHHVIAASCNIYIFCSPRVFHLLPSHISLHPSVFLFFFPLSHYHHAPFPLLPAFSPLLLTKNDCFFFTDDFLFVCFFQNWLTFSCTLALRPYLPLPMLPLSLIHTCSVKFPLIFSSFIRCSLSSVSLCLLYPFSFSSFFLSHDFSSFPFTASCEAATQPRRNRRAQTEHMNVN